VTCLTLQAAAIVEFHGGLMSRWWHVLPTILAAVIFALVIDKFATRTILCGAIFGAGMLALAILVQRFDPHTRGSARWLLLTGYLVGAATTFSRSIISILEPASVPDMLAPTPFQSITYLFGLSVVMVTSIGFMLLHKERSEIAAQKLALTDPLTGAFNRRTFLELAEKEIARTRRARGSLSLIMLDLDHFKQMNDRNGHLAGDEVLKGVVIVVQTCLRKEDLLVRYGGEEFCILLPGVAIDRTVLLAERIRDAVEQAKFAFNGRTLQVTVSVGVSALSPEGTEGVDKLVDRADEALYTAKKAGRNRVVACPANTTLAMLMMSQH
ncbi:MAG: GGDEF domain-containing protein, partial [Usitatibacteraceae bacterium]